MSIFIGEGEIFKTLQNKPYLKGWIGKIPILGFFDKKNPNLIHFVIDEKSIAEISKKNENLQKSQKTMIRQYMKSQNI